MHPLFLSRSRPGAAEFWESRETANPPLTATLGASQDLDNTRFSWGKSGKGP
jgi:hypothetical protein